jgi:hypothetical protein
MVGASGTVMGMLALVALWYPNLTVMFWGVLPMRMATLALILIGIDLLFVFSASGNVANSAHLGGALFGWLYYRFGGRVERLFREMDRRADRKRVHKALPRARGQAPPPMTHAWKAAVIGVPILLILLLLRTCALASSTIWLQEISQFDPEAQIQVDTPDLIVIAPESEWSVPSGRAALRFKRMLVEHYRDLLGHGRDHPLLFLSFGTHDQFQRHHQSKSGSRVQHVGGWHDGLKGAIFLPFGAPLGTVRHEIVHLLVSESDPKAPQLTPWLSEGLAQAFERVDPDRSPLRSPGVPINSIDQVRRFLARRPLDVGRLISIREYSDFTGPAEVHRNYTEALVLTAFLLSARPRDLLEEYVAYERNTTNQRAQAFRSIYKYDGEPFRKDLDTFVRGLLAR